jgi:hypothetical protein
LVFPVFSYTVLNELQLPICMSRSPTKPLSAAATHQALIGSLSLPNQSCIFDFVVGVFLDHLINFCNNVFRSLEFFPTSRRRIKLAQPPHFQNITGAFLGNNRP